MAITLSLAQTAIRVLVSAATLLVPIKKVGSERRCRMPAKSLSKRRELLTGVKIQHVCGSFPSSGGQKAICVGKCPLSNRMLYGTVSELQRYGDAHDIRVRCS